jgi:hypothetical protein
LPGLFSSQHGGFVYNSYIACQLRFQGNWGEAVMETFFTDLSMYIVWFTLICLLITTLIIACQIVHFLHHNMSALFIPTANWNFKSITGEVVWHLFSFNSIIWDC